MIIMTRDDCGKETKMESMPHWSGLRSNVRPLTPMSKTKVDVVKLLNHRVDVQKVVEPPFS